MYKRLANQSAMAKKTGSFGNKQQWSSPFNVRRVRELEKKANLMIKRANNNDRARLLTDIQDNQTVKVQK